MIERPYSAQDWYWIIGGDQTQVFSSARNALVPVSDQAYLDWGWHPSAIDTLDNLKQVLTDAGVPPYKPVTPARARVVLQAAGKLDAVNTAVASASQDVQLYWEYSTEIHRIHPYVELLRQAVGLSSEEADALFTQAAQ